MKDLIKRYAELIGTKETKDMLATKEVKQALIINTLKIDAADLVKQLGKKGVTLKKTHSFENAYVIDHTAKSLGSFPEYLHGEYYLLDTGSIAVAKALDAKKQESVLDMCAAPGGKLIYSAIMMANKGHIVALDSKNRIGALKNNIERMGITNTMCFAMDATSAKLGLKFDKILLDAPCSGNFISDPSWFKKRSAKQFKERSSLQKALLMSAAELLKKNGYIIYATCSIEPEENEEVVQWALDNLEVVVEDTKLNIGSDGLTKIFGEELDAEISKCRRFWPHKTKTQPFFLAKLRRK